MILIVGRLFILTVVMLFVIRSIRHSIEILRIDVNHRCDMNSIDGKHNKLGIDMMRGDAEYFLGRIELINIQLKYHPMGLTIEPYYSNRAEMIDGSEDYGHPYSIYKDGVELHRADSPQGVKIFLEGYSKKQTI